MKEYDVIALGELLIDFTENGTSNQGNPLLEANPGGAPCNVLAMLTKLGNKTAFIGKVGSDNFGRMLKERVTGLGIDTSSLYEDETVPTTLAFVHTMPGGDRDFSFYRNPGADMMLTKEDIKEEMLSQTKLFHFGTLSMTHELVREATKTAVNIVKAHKKLISFDPNIREPLWDSMDNARKQVEYGMGVCNILKISDNEIQWFTGEEDFDKGVQKIKEKYGIQLILVSMGSKGSRAYYEDLIVEAPALLNKNTIETTGAGDTFDACVLDYVLKHGLDDLNGENLTEMLQFANAAASLITTRKGALSVMPEKAEVLKEAEKYQ